MDQTISGGAGIGTAEKFGQHHDGRSCLGCRWLAIVPQVNGARYRCGFGLYDASFSLVPTATLQRQAANCKQYAPKD